MIARVLSNNLGIVSWFCLWHLSIAGVYLPGVSWPISAVGFLCQMRSRYLWCLLEAKMTGVIHGLGSLGGDLLIPSRAWRSMTALRTLSYCSASSVALVLGDLISSEFLISALLFCYWTLIQLLHHSAWLCWAYWRYRNLFDWLIDRLKAAMLITFNSQYLIVCGIVRLWSAGMF